MTFDPNAAAQPGSGLFGLVASVDEASCVVLPVPFAATTSYRCGAQHGPELVLRASRQVELFDHEIGAPYEAGIALDAISPQLLEWHRAARTSAEIVIAAGGANDDTTRAAAAAVNGYSERVNDLVYERTRHLLQKQKFVAVLGGDHAVPYGAIKAVAEWHPGVGILHVDAHADLRNAYEGFTWSHASIMHNVLTRVPQVSRLVQVGIRDYSEEERAFQREQGKRVSCFFDADLSREQLRGVSFASLVQTIVAELPQDVYVSFDVDGLDPVCCPNTGTPVPGGLSFQQATYLLAELGRSGRRIVGVDLNEVSGGEHDVLPDSDVGEWDGNVGARLLYKLIGWMLASNGRVTRTSV